MCFKADWGKKNSFGIKTRAGTSKSQHDSIKTETDLEHRKSNGNDITGLVLLISHSLLAVQSGGKIWLCDVFQFSFPILIFAPFCLLPGLTQWLRVSLSSNQLRHFFHLPLAVLCYSRYEKIILPTAKKKWAWLMVRVVWFYCICVLCVLLTWSIG